MAFDGRRCHPHFAMNHPTKQPSKSNGQNSKKPRASKIAREFQKMTVKSRLQKTSATTSFQKNQNCQSKELSPIEKSEMTPKDPIQSEIRKTFKSQSTRKSGRAGYIDVPDFAQSNFFG
jgi:hypothetical protein